MGECTGGWRVAGRRRRGKGEDESRGMRRYGRLAWHVLSCL